MMAWMNGAELDGLPLGPAPEDMKRLVVEGRRVYESLCVLCHGILGNGRGPEASSLSVPPSDFTRGTFKFRSTASGQPAVLLDVFRTISKGVHGTAMLPWVSWLSERAMAGMSSQDMLVWRASRSLSLPHPG